MNKRQKGFSVVEIIMALVIVGLLGALGWMYWNNIANKPKEQSKSSDVKSTVTNSPSLNSMEKNTYRTKNFSLAFDYPSSWKVDNVSTTGSIQERVLLSSPDGFKLLYTTMPYGGLGGVGGGITVSDFQYYGDSGLSGKYVISYTYMDKFYMQLATYNTVDAANQDGLGYGNILNFAEPKEGTDGYTDDPVNVVFGTSTYARMEPVTITKPGDRTLDEAVNILKSLRKI